MSGEKTPDKGTVLLSGKTPDKRTVPLSRISVRNLVEFILRSGDIDNRRGSFADKDAMQAGSRIHRQIQSRMGSGYQAEVPLAIDIPGEGYILTVEGRADGILTDDTGVLIDEIKGVYRDVSQMEEPVPIHVAQAKCYGCIYGLQHDLEQIRVQMTYCNIETEEIRRFCDTYQVKELEEWFFDLISQYQKWTDMEKRWKEIRQSSAKEIAFPFPWREGQKEVAGSVYRTISRKKTLFIQAPTGTGKTLSTVFPAVKAVGEDLADKIFYATAKTVTRTVAEEAFELLRKQGLHMKTITLTAKEKICFMEEAECNPEKCPYAKGHFDRVNDAVFELVSRGEIFDRETLEKQAEKWQVCPFEFSLDVSLWADAIICDYNYIFDPRAKLKRFFGEGVKGSYLFLIDEAHNLVDRGREMFSASLYKEDFLALKKEVKPYSQKMTRALNRCNTWLLEQKRECERMKVLSGIGTFPVYLMNLCGIMEEFLEDSHHQELNQKILELYFQVSRFLDTCDCLDENYVIYTEMCEDGRFMIRLFCVDISENLQNCLEKGRSTVYFSATFLPIHYYKSLLSAEKDDYAIYAHSIFDPTKRLVLVGGDTTTKYTSRQTSEYCRIADYVMQIIKAKRGNYMVFFSSYRMMEDVAEQFQILVKEQAETVELSCQFAGMREKEREEFLLQFEENHLNGFAGFCVMGGIFGEGIDLRHDRLIGAIIVGTGIPQICSERELLKQFYDKRGDDGFFYAYLCPGMNRVLQSAGRVIRTEEDTGVVVLLDERFASSRYYRMFPQEWKQVQLCTLSNIRKTAEQFWNCVDST